MSTRGINVRHAPAPPCSGGGTEGQQTRHAQGPESSTLHGAGLLGRAEGRACLVRLMWCALCVLCASASLCVCWLLCVLVAGRRPKGDGHGAGAPRSLVNPGRAAPVIPKRAADRPRDEHNTKETNGKCSLTAPLGPSPPSPHAEEGTRALLFLLSFLLPPVVFVSACVDPWCPLSVSFPLRAGRCLHVPRDSSGGTAAAAAAAAAGTGRRGDSGQGGGGQALRRARRRGREGRAPLACATASESALPCGCGGRLRGARADQTQKRGKKGKGRGGTGRADMPGASLFVRVHALPLLVPLQRPLHCAISSSMSLVPRRRRAAAGCVPA
jgi:hypothetical protein